VRTVQRWPVIGLAMQAVLLAVLGSTVGLTGAGIVLAAATALATAGALALGLQRARPAAFGAANLVTLARAGLVVGVAGLLPAPDDAARWALVALASVALLLDLVDGRVARATGGVTALGARFDMETDALLIGLLSVEVVLRYGGSASWVLLIGAARYLLWLAERTAPWLRAATPPRSWAKVVAAIQGVLLTLACARLLPTGLTLILLAVGLVLLVESFGWQLRWRWRHRAETGGAPALTATLLAGALVWIALVLPDRTTDLSVLGLLRVPVEAAVLLALVVVLPRRAGGALALIAGLLLAVVVLLKVLDAGFYTVFDRPFDLLNDWYYLGPGFGVLVDSVGRRDAIVTAIEAAVLVVVTGTVLPLCLLRLARAARRTGRARRRAVVVAVAIAAAWAVADATGVDLTGGVAMASASSYQETVGEVSHLRGDLADKRAFAQDLTHDPYAGATPDLSALRGKDVLLVFVESYGRVAVQGSDFAPAVDRELDRGTSQLDAAGYGERSAFLTSPTFGAGSWLAHSTLQSGLWVDSQQRYDQLLNHPRLTLTDAFAQDGWRTVFDVPSITQPWPEGQRFYHFDQLYDAGNVGYRGPAFSYATMPDQYTLAAFRRLELDPHPRPPVMAEIDLVSSHHPWTPLPHLIPWSQVGDGSAYDGMPAQGLSPDVAFRDPEKVKQLYGRSIVYTWQSLVSFLRHDHDPNLVVIAVGDHQPHSYVSGANPGQDVPITVIARDPAVLGDIDGWHWQSGLRPGPDAPVWRMDRFRDAFFAAFDGR
jgi:phosphatidylglycerophosphate synthase